MPNSGMYTCRQLSLLRYLAVQPIDDVAYKLSDLVRRVQLGLNRMINEMVVDGGGHFSPAGIDGVHTLTFLFSSLAAHWPCRG